MTTNLIIFATYFLTILVVFSVVTMTSSATKKQVVEFLKGNTILALSVAVAFTILMQLVGNTVDLFTLVILAIFGVIEENIFLPIIMGEEFKKFPRKAIIITIIVANLIEFGLLYLFIK